MWSKRTNLATRPTLKVGPPEAASWSALATKYWETMAKSTVLISPEIVFSDKNERLALEGIVWPEIRKLTSIRLAEAEAAGADVAVVEAAVLLEAGWDDLFDEVWTVETPRELAKARLMGRQSISADEADARLAAQLESADRASRSSVVIENTGTVAELKSAVTAAYENLIAGGTSRQTGRDPK